MKLDNFRQCATRCLNFHQDIIHYNVNVDQKEAQRTMGTGNGCFIKVTLANKYLDVLASATPSETP